LRTEWVYRACAASGAVTEGFSSQSIIQKLSRLVDRKFNSLIDQKFNRLHA
jgi:hypothetical protein